MANTDKIEMVGTVIESNRGSTFKVKLNDNDVVLNCSISGRLRMNHIRILNGDSVTVQISPYDLTRGIIIWRDK